MSEFDHVVVGAEIVGSWTALHLRKLGKNVLLLDQFTQPHTRGSSHGQSRLIRSGYVEDFFAEMMPHAYKMWRTLEEETEKEILVKTSMLCVVPSSEEEQYKKCIFNMKRLCPQDVETLSADEVKSKFSQIFRFDGSSKFFVDKTGGVLFAHKAVLAVQALFRDRGGHFWDNCKVTQIVPEGDDITLFTSRGNVTVRSVIVCAGPWTQKLLTPHLIPSLPLQPAAVKVYYWKIKACGTNDSPVDYPALLNFGEPNVYALPPLEYPGLFKVCVHGGVASDPDERDKTPQSPKLERIIKTYVKEHLPFLEHEPAIIETCMYTNSPDEIFILDTLPKHKNIIVGCGFSGTGFKTSPAVGKLLSEMATGAKPYLDISPYSLSRFSSQ